MWGVPLLTGQCRDRIHVGMQQNYNRALTLHDKRGKKKFKVAVAKCLDRDILAAERIPNFA